MQCKTRVLGWVALATFSVAFVGCGAGEADSTGEADAMSADAGQDQPDSALDQDVGGPDQDVSTEPDATVCNNCECMVEGDPCPPGWLESDCLWSGQGPWCGENIHASGGCECVEEVWTCHEPGPDPGYCHDCCQAAEDDPSTFCATDGTCVQAILCEAESCCVPGTQGDTYCVGVFGDASACVAHDTGGTCSETP